MKLSVTSLTRGLTFHGEVQGKRPRDYVLSSPPHQHFVMSVSSTKPWAGSFTLAANLPSTGSTAGCGGSRVSRLGWSSAGHGAGAWCRRPWLA
jgi:hypothetical protein